MKFIYLFSILILCSCNKESKEIAQIQNSVITTVQENVIQTDKVYGFNVIQNADNTFGYQIYKDGVKVIRQEYMPAVPGNNGFKTETQAKALATLVINKLKNNIMPPTVSVEEVDSINSLK